MAGQRPIFLVIGGGWHAPDTYDLLKAHLADGGYECIVPKLLTVGPQAAGVTWAADTALIHQTVGPLFDQGKEVVLVGHSYGGIPACVAVEGNGTAERARRGLRGGFRAMIFMASFALPKRGLDLLGFFGGKWPDWVHAEGPYMPNSLVTVDRELVKQIWYNDLPEDDDCSEGGEQQEQETGGSPPKSKSKTQSYYASLVLPHSQDSLETPVPFAATDLRIPRYFLVCERDVGVPGALQHAMAAGVPGMRVRSVDAGHSCFLSKPGETARLLMEMGEEAAGWGVEEAEGGKLREGGAAAAIVTAAGEMKKQEKEEVVVKKDVPPVVTTKSPRRSLLLRGLRGWLTKDRAVY